MELVPSTEAPARRPVVDRYARISLAAAFAVAVLGHLLSRLWGAPVMGGFVAAMGEAGLIGGLADWYAVRALFSSPLGIRWHTAIVPRNKDRIIRQVRLLLMEQWLPPRVFEERIAGVDLVERTVALLESPKARDGVVRGLAGALADSVRPTEITRALAGPLARGLRQIDASDLTVRLAARARRERWLEPLVQVWSRRITAWARSPQCTETIFQSLYRSWSRYKQEQPLHKFFGKLGELLGAVDLRSMSQKLQLELAAPMERQDTEGSELMKLLDRMLEDLERKASRDPEFGMRLQHFVKEALGEEVIHKLLDPVLAALWNDLERDVRAAESQIVERLVDQLNAGLNRLATDPTRRERANAWLRERLVAVIQKHHVRFGDILEEQLQEYSDKHLVAMIEDRIGDDLNWIRINGACVGGAIGLVLHGLWLVFDGLAA